MDQALVYNNPDKDFEFPETPVYRLPSRILRTLPHLPPLPLVYPLRNADYSLRFGVLKVEEADLVDLLKQTIEFGCVLID